MIKINTLVSDQELYLQMPPTYNLRHWSLRIMNECSFFSLFQLFFNEITKRSFYNAHRAILDVLDECGANNSSFVNPIDIIRLVKARALETVHFPSRDFRD